ncbi:MAG: hypothetical protein HZB55_22600 [Deltaproteobacteria bacterium]|nr:hypothetical protein [Deltaproteobacteria bacterium]
MDPKTLENWFRLSADALKGAEEAKKAMEALTQNPLSPEGLSKWAEAWMPKGSPPPETENVRQFQDLVEESWKAIGVVPRYRYLELLEKYEQLRERLKEAEEALANLREIIGARGKEEEARGILDSWEEITREALKTQGEWMRSWTEGAGKEKEDKKR